MWRTCRHWKQTTSPLKTNDVATENKCTWWPFGVIELASILYVPYEVAIAEKCTVPGFRDHDLHDRKQRFLISVKAQKEVILTGLFSAAYQNGDQ